MAQCRVQTKPVATALTEEQRQLAMERFAILRPHLEDDVPWRKRPVKPEFRSEQPSAG